jgi:hypothetical protein
VQTERRKLRQRRVPSSQLGRVMGFAGLGARLAAGTAVDSITSIFRCANLLHSCRPATIQTSLRYCNANDKPAAGGSSGHIQQSGSFMAHGSSHYTAGAA